MSIVRRISLDRLEESIRSIEPPPLPVPAPPPPISPLSELAEKLVSAAVNGGAKKLHDDMIADAEAVVEEAQKHLETQKKIAAFILEEATKAAMATALLQAKHRSLSEGYAKVRDQHEAPTTEEKPSEPDA